MATEDEKKTGVRQRISLGDRARLLRFLVARGAGDKADELLKELWQRVAAGSGEPVAVPVSYLFRAAEALMRDLRRETVRRVPRPCHRHDTSSDEMPHVDGRIARERLRQAEETLEALGPRVATAFRRYRIDGVGQAAIAQELGISRVSVENDQLNAYRALTELKARFDTE